MQNEERINGLETQVRTLKRIVYGFGCLLVAGVVVSATSLQTIPEVIQARSFEVVNDKGQKLVHISHTYDAGYVGTFSTKSSKEGQELVVLTSTVSGGYIGTHTKEGQEVVKIGTENGVGYVATKNKDGQNLVLITGSKKSEGGAILTMNKEGRVRVSLGTTNNGGGFVETWSKEGNRRELSSNDYGGHVATLNKEGRLEDSTPGTPGDVNKKTLTAKEVAKEFESNKSRATSTGLPPKN